MSSIAKPKQFFTFAEVLQAKNPRILAQEKLVAFLAPHLERLKIIWSPEAFMGGLGNPMLPISLLEKLEKLISRAEVKGWKASSVLKRELDTTVEDIETFNPAFQKSMLRALEGVKRGKTISQEKLFRELGL